MRKSDIPKFKKIIEKNEDLDLTLDDLQKIVAYKNEIVKYLQTHRISLLVSKADERDSDQEQKYGNQIDILAFIMDELRNNIEKSFNELSKNISKE